MSKSTVYSPDGNAHTTLGFRGAVVTPDERYIIFIPHGGGSASPKHGNVVRCVLDDRMDGLCHY